MSFDETVEAMIREAQERGDFNNLSNQGKPIDLTSYFESPEAVRVAQSVLKNAGYTSRELELLNEIAALKDALATVTDDQEQQAIRKQIREKQLDFDLTMERQKRQRR